MISKQATLYLFSFFYFFISIVDTKNLSSRISKIISIVRGYFIYFCKEYLIDNCYKVHILFLVYDFLNVNLDVDVNVDVDVDVFLKILIICIGNI